MLHAGLRRRAGTAGAAGAARRGAACVPWREWRARGALFERNCCEFLQRALRLEVQGVGGANDGGLDIVGSWPAPQGDAGGVWVVAQCKSYSQDEVEPGELRELEGSLGAFATRRPSGTAAAPAAVLGLLCGHSGFSALARRSCLRSEQALALVDFESSDCHSLRLFLLNQRARELLPWLKVAQLRDGIPAVFADSELLYPR
jgi:hypothetical protein